MPGTGAYWRPTQTPVPHHCFGCEFTIGTANREESWLVCVGLRRLPSRSESWELIPHGGYPREIMTEAMPSTRLARLLDRQVDHDNPDGGSGCHRQHRHSQFAVPHSMRQPPAGPCLCGPAGVIHFLWHALRMDHETRYRLWPAHPAAMPRRAAHGTRGSMAGEETVMRPSPTCLSGTGLGRVRSVSCPLIGKRAQQQKFIQNFKGSCHSVFGTCKL